MPRSALLWDNGGHRHPGRDDRGQQGRHGLGGDCRRGVRVYPTSTILRNRGTGTNETTAYFGRPTAIVIGERMGTTFDVDPYGLFTTAQVRLRMLRRVAVLIWIPAYFTKLTAVIV